MSIKKLFISVTSASKDMSLARSFAGKFKEAGIEPFLSEEIEIGQYWSERIEFELEHCDYFMVILSETAIRSEMVREEVRLARKIAERDGRPMDLFPVRMELPMSVELTYELGGYLNRIQQRTWKDELDTDIIFREILQTMRVGEVPLKYENDEDEQMPDDIPYDHMPMEFPSGIVRLNSPYYVTRKSETEFIKRLHLEGALLRVRAPRQFGKTSLLVRMMDEATRSGYYVLPLSMQQFDQETLESRLKLMTQINEAAAQVVKTATRWHNEYALDLMDVKASSTSFWESHILSLTDRPILMVMDEADLLFKNDSVSSDIFGLIRTWHENSKVNPLWTRLRIAIAYSTDALLPIQDVNQSPFNVGEVKRLKEFTLKEISDLAEKHHYQMSEKKVIRLRSAIGGHPYLTRLALYLLARREYSFNALMTHVASDKGPFADHLNNHYINLMRNDELKETLRQILKYGYTKNPLHVSKLTAVGLVKDEDNELRPSYEIYRRFFKKVLL